MSDEDTILEARKYVPHYIRQITWSAADQTWVVLIPELPGCKTFGDTADLANRNADEAILMHLLGLKESGQNWPLPRKMNSNRPGV